MLEEIVTALKSHATTVEGAARIWNDARKDIEANYKNHLMQDKLTEGKKVYEDTLQESRNTNLAVCVALLDKIRMNAQKVAAMPVDQTFPTALDALQRIGNPTPAEIEILTGQYKNNYFAYRAICEALGGSVKGFSTITIDDVLSICEALEDLCRRCVNESPASYIYRLTMTGKNLEAPDQILTAFIEGRFDDALTTFQESKNQDGSNEGRDQA